MDMPSFSDAALIDNSISQPFDDVFVFVEHFLELFDGWYFFEGFVEIELPTVLQAIELFRNLDNFHLYNPDVIWI